MLLSHPAPTPEAEPVVDRNDPSVVALVRAAVEGNRPAWDEIVERYTPLVLSVTGRFGLATADRADVSQTVWLQLLQHLSTLREPNALPGWIVSTVRHECIRLRREQHRSTTVDPQDPVGLLQRLDDDRAGATDEDLLRQERHEALLAGFAELSARQRELLLLLLRDPPPSYSEISARTGIPVGAIGPTRARALDRLRHAPALAALVSDPPNPAEVK